MQRSAFPDRTLEVTPTYIEELVTNQDLYYSHTSHVENSMRGCKSLRYRTVLHNCNLPPTSYHIYPHEVSQTSLRIVEIQGAG